MTALKFSLAVAPVSVVPYSRVTIEEGASGTTYTYYNDDMLYTSMDARGASATFAYNARHLVNSITYYSPNETVIPNSPSVTFQYDELGNRTVMNDGAGTLTYGYNSLGRLTSESRYFSELASHQYKYQNNQPLQTTYQIGYSYNLAGQLQQITTPTGDTIDYTRDDTGRSTRVYGTPRDGVTEYVSDVDYRAWGAEKRFAFGYLNYSYSMNYNDRMQVSQIDDGDKLAAAFTYTNDGKLSTVQGLHGDRRLDRSYSYDHVGRVTKTRSATEAGLGSTEPAQFRQDYGYDEFDHMTLRQGRYWYSGDNTFSATYTNNIASGVTELTQPQNWQYDAEGNIASEGGRTHTFDVAGRKVKSIYPGSKSDSFYYDGDGRLASQTYTETFTGQPNGNSTYYLWSSALNENLAQVRIYGRQLNGDRQDYYRDVFIYVNGQQVAIRKYDQGLPQSQPNLSSVVNWGHRDPLNTMAYAGNASGRDLYSIDPLGVEVKAAYQLEMDNYWGGSPDPNNPPEGFYQDSGGNPGTYGSSAPNPGQWGLGCSIDGIRVSCEKAFRTFNNGGAAGAMLNITGAVGWGASSSVAGFMASATAINGQSTTRMRLVLKVIPGDPNGLTVKGSSGEILDSLAPIHGIFGSEAVYEEVGAISGALVFGGGQSRPTWAQRNNIPVHSEYYMGYANAKSILSGNDDLAKSCKAAVASTKFPDPVKLLDTIRNKGNTMYHDDKVDPVEGQDAGAKTSGVGENATIMFWARYFSVRAGSIITVGGNRVRLDRVQTQALAWLHELSHATGKYGHKDDGQHEYTKSNAEVGEILYNSCIKGARLPKPKYRH